MREILFRGKNIDNGHWMYGVPISLKNGETYMNFEFMGWIDRALVIPEAVGQYTGLTDKNGTKIFEGDIVDVNNALLRGRFWVEYEETGGTFIVKDKNDRRYFLGGCNCTVIGNIFDNPELIELDVHKVETAESE